MIPSHRASSTSWAQPAVAPTEQSNKPGYLEPIPSHGVGFVSLAGWGFFCATPSSVQGLQGETDFVGDSFCFGAHPVLLRSYSWLCTPWVFGVTQVAIFSASTQLLYYHSCPLFWILTGGFSFNSVGLEFSFPNINFLLKKNLCVFSPSDIDFCVLKAPI